jgi:carbamoyl-phosphate synthase large subunit
VLIEAGIDIKIINKVAEGQPHVVDALKNDEIDLIVNTTEGKQAIRDSSIIRRTALQHKVYNATTMAGARACVEAVRHGDSYTVHRLQDLHQRLLASS